MAFLSSLLRCVFIYLQLISPLGYSNLIQKQLNGKKECRYRVVLGSENEIFERSSNNSIQRKELCISPSCIMAADTLLQSINTKVHPCDNFFDFVCGNWRKRDFIPESRQLYNSFIELEEERDTILKKLLEEEINPKEETLSSLWAKQTYKACMNDSHLNRLGAEPLLDLLYLIMGGLPAISTKWNHDRFDWPEVLASMRTYGANFLFSMEVNADDGDSSKNIIHLDEPSLGITREYFLDPKYYRETFVYLQYMIQLGELLGGFNKTKLQIDMSDVLKFETQLANFTTPWNKRRNVTERYNKMTLKHLEYATEINFFKYFQKVMPPEIEIDPFEEVLVSRPDFFQNLGDLMYKTPKRVIANYLGFRLAASYVKDISKVFITLEEKFLRSLTNAHIAQPSWSICVAHTTNYLQDAVGALYVKKVFNAKHKSEVEKIINDVNKALEKLLDKQDWMDEQTKWAAKEKLENILYHAGYPDYILDSRRLDAEHWGLVISSEEHFYNKLNLQRFWSDEKLRQLIIPVNRLRIETSLAAVNSYYNRFKNSMVFPAAVIQTPFFDQEQARSLNYGGIGVIIGHEMMHAFDDEGRKYDKNGNLHQWWSKDAENTYLNKAQCFIHQYNNFTTETGLKLNGVNTQGENIADNEGLHLAYLAYKESIRREGEETMLLPGLHNFTHDQLFFISYGFTWCGTMSRALLKTTILNAVHTPIRYRVIGPVSNSNEFSKAFNCPQKAAMNPENKCSLW